MSLAAPLPSQAARTLISGRTAVARCIDTQLRTRPALLEHSRQSSAGVCLAMADDNPFTSSPAAGTRRRTAAKAAFNAGNVPDEGLPRVEDVATDADEHAGHAILHDFCMVIPYGLILGLAGVIALLFKGFNAGVVLLSGGVASGVLASLSLKSWKQHKGSQLFTTASAGIALALTVSMWQRPAVGMAALAAKALSLLSGAMLLFLVYNVAAGGNPPKKDGDTSDPLAPAEDTITLPLSS